MNAAVELINTINLFIIYCIVAIAISIALPSIICNICSLSFFILKKTNKFIREKSNAVDFMLLFGIVCAVAAVILIILFHYGPILFYLIIKFVIKSVAAFNSLDATVKNIISVATIFILGAMGGLVFCKWRQKNNKSV